MFWLKRSDVFISDLSCSSSVVWDFHRLQHWNVKTGKMKCERHTVFKGTYWKRSDGILKVQTENNDVRKEMKEENVQRKNESPASE